MWFEENVFKCEKVLRSTKKKKMTNWNKVIAITGIISLIAMIIFGFFQLGIFDKKSQPSKKLNLSEIKDKEIKIEKFTTSQEIYASKNKVIAKAKIKNTLEIPYNVTFTWIYNDRIYYDETIPSTKYYNLSEEENEFDYSLGPGIPWLKKWEVQVLIEYIYKNQSFTEENITAFEIIRDN